jgi:ubiquitin-like 1-activating enzyme E1 A
MATTTTNNNNNDNKKTPVPSENEVYDRQIRLWGAEAQKKMQSSKVLYVHVTGTSSEVIKNLVLAGIAAELCDPRPANVLDLAPCFFSPTDPANMMKTKKRMKYASAAHAVQPMVEELNPLLGSCPVLDREVADLTEDDLKDFTVVVASQIPIDEAVRLSKIVTSQGHAFYTADCFGMTGASMIDMGRSFEYRPEQGKKLLDPVPLKEYIPISDMVRVPLNKAVNRFHKQPPPAWVAYRCLLEYQKRSKQWLGGDDVDTDAAKKTVQDFLNEQQASLSDDDLEALVMAGIAQVAPVCAVLGGMIGNEVIKFISGKGEPANNSILLEGNACKAWTFLVKAKD